MLKTELKLYTDYIIQYIKFENNFIQQLIEELAALKIYIPQEEQVRIIEIYKYLALMGLSGLIWFLKQIFSKFLIMYVLVRIYILILDILYTNFRIFPLKKDLEKRFNVFENIGILLAIIQTCRHCSAVSNEDVKLVSRCLIGVYTNERVQIMIIIQAICWILFRKEIKNYFNNEIIFKIKGKSDSVSLYCFKEVYGSLLHACIEILLFFLILLIFLRKALDVYDFLYYLI